MSGASHTPGPWRVGSDLEKVLDACDWPSGSRFSFRDEPGEHDPCYVVMPGGAMMPLCHHALNGVDQARAQFIVNACNAALAGPPVKDLLAALQGLRPFLEDEVSAACADIQEGNSGELSPFAEAANRALALLAKARGAQ